jgi:DNA polymerase III sliding clamp (beta) subunit (PCNA family)
MSVLKQIAQSVFNHQKRKHGSVYRSPVLKPAIVSKRKPVDTKPKRRKKAPLETLVDIAYKFTCSKSNNSLGTIKLDCIKVPGSSQGRILVEATDTEQWFSGSTVQVVDDSTATQVCIDAKKAKAAVALQIGRFNRIRIGKNGAEINNIYVPVGCDSEDYPPIPASIDVATQKCRFYNIPDLKQAIPFLAKAAGKDTDRGYVSSIFFDLKRGKLVTTDGRRIHITPTGRMAYKPRYTGRDIMIPSSVSNVARVLSGDFQVLQDSHVIFEIEIPNCSAEAGYRLIDGKFRNYSDVMVKKFSGSCKVGRLDLVRALRRIKKHKQGICVKVGFKGGKMYTQDYYDSKSRSIALISGRHTGKDFIAGINPIFLHDAINGMPDKEVEISLPELPKDPWTIEGTESKYMALIMPMNIK